MWNYRIIKTDQNFGLYEVIYNEEGKISAHTAEPEIVADDVDELIEYLELMLQDAKKSKNNILEEDKINFAPLCKEEDMDNFLPYEGIDKIN